MIRSPISNPVLLLLSIMAFVPSAFAATEDTPAAAFAVLDALGGEAVWPDSGPAGAWRLEITNPASAGSSSLVPVEGQPFDQALRIEVAARPIKAFDVQILANRPSATAIHAGDTVLVAVPMRTLSSDDESGEGSLGVWCNVGGEWIPACTPMANREWTVTWGRIEAIRDYRAGELGLRVHCSPHRQVIELGPLHWRNLGKVTDTAKLPRNIFSYEGREADAPWRKEADQRIERLRKGDLTVRVQDADGTTCSGATIGVEQLRHAYRFGCYVEFPSPSQFPRWQERFLELFNAATVPVFWGPGPGRAGPGWGWATASGPASRAEFQDIAAWAAGLGLPLQGHTLLYERWDLMPGEIYEARGDPTLLRRLVNEHLREVVEAQAPLRFHSYQVINEHLGSSVLADALGGLDEVAAWFHLVRAANSGPRLMINDNTILSSPGSHVQHQRYEDLARGLIALGAPLGAIGFQAHFGNRPTGIPQVLALLDRFAAIGLPLEATEFTVRGEDEELQADFTRDFYTAFFSHPGTDGITAWGFWAGRHYNPSFALLRQDWSEKPNGRAYRELVRGRWWTRVSVTSDADGIAQIRGFKGAYRITVRHRSLVATVETEITDQSRIIDIRLPREGAP